MVLKKKNFALIQYLQEIWNILNILLSSQKDHFLCRIEVTRIKSIN